MQVTRVVETLASVRATSSRLAKADALVACLRAADPGEVGVVAAWLAGAIPQRRTGVGWRSLSELPPAATDPSLTVLEVDAAFTTWQGFAGDGSAGARSRAVRELLSRATAGEQELIVGLVLGEVRAGAKEGLLVDAVAKAYETPIADVRRAVMLAGSASAIATLLAEGGNPTSVGLEVMRPAQPMLASPAASLDEAVERVGLPCVVDAKLDGIRVQVHRDGDAVGVWSRSLDDLTGRFPEIEAAVRELPCTSIVLDGEALLVDADGRPRAFQETASVSMTRAGSQTVMTAFFFDVLHLDGEDLLDAPLSARMERLTAIVPATGVVSRQFVETLEEATSAQTAALAAGQEGVVVKSLDGTWQAGRRGATWLKVKPVHTLDLVVLAVEWGSGRRQGTLSNIHLGARDDSAPGGFVMLGKTFKGMTDEMLAWQTERFLGLETHRQGHVVYVRPEQVVEIAFDGVQRSTRYPGGVALRFARVLRYRDDKAADAADSLEAVRTHLH